MIETKYEWFLVVAWCVGAVVLLVAEIILLLALSSGPLVVVVL